MKTKRINKNREIVRPRFVNKSALMLIFSILLIAGTIFYVVESSSLGSHLAKIERAESGLRQENRDLSDQLVNFDSLTNIASKQEELSFVKPTQIIYMKAEENVAKAF